MKKTIAMLTAAALTLSLAACSSAPASSADSAASSGSTAASTAEQSAADSVRIAIVQQMDHASLDEIRAAIEAELDA